MKYYFGQTSDFSLTLFGPIHLLLIISTILIVFLIFKNKEKLRTYKFLKKLIPIILFSNMITYIVGAVFCGIFDINIHLPIHYC